MKFNIKGIVFDISYPVVAAMACVAVLDQEHRVLLCFMSAVIHECGHLIAMTLFSIKPSYIQLRLFDVLISAKTDKSFFSDMVITIAGPLSNIIFALLLLWIYTPFSIANLVIGIFNLLPVESFDGGHILRLLLSKRFDDTVCNRIITVSSLIFLIPFIVIGTLVLFESKYNYSLLFIGLYLVAVLFLK